MDSKEGPRSGAWSSVDPHGHPRIPYRGYYDRESCDKRRKWVEEFSSCSLAHTGQWWDNEGADDSCSCLKLKGNIENPIGLAKIPVGIAGPLLIKGDHVSGYVLCPLATTEGAIIASATRGATALTRAGGVSVKSIDKAMLRCPCFKLRSISEVETFVQWISTNFESISKQVKFCSEHAKLIEIIPAKLGRLVILTAKYDTRDAAGQNMVTTITWHICKWINENVGKDLPRIKILEFWIESNLSADKNVTPLNMTRTRGLNVQVEAWIPEAVLKSVLKVDVASFLEMYYTWIQCNSYSGSIGLNINIVNILAAVFIATGQDVASVVESSAAQLLISPASVKEIEAHAEGKPGLDESRGESDSLEQQSEEHLERTQCGGVYVCLVLPSLVIGTVGGGTGIATQMECLQLLGCFGNGGVERLGEIIAGFALSLDLSTLAALASGQFAVSHEKLGRNHPTHGLKPEHLNDDFFKKVLGSKGELIGVESTSIDTGNSILSELTKSEMSKKVGHFGYNIRFRNESGQEDTLQVVLKSKPTGLEVCNMLNKTAQGCGLDLAMVYEQFKTKTGFRFTSIREVELCQSLDESLKKLLPRIHYVHCLLSKNVYAIVMELLTPGKVMLLNTADDVSVWSEPDIKVVLRDIAKIHARYLNKVEELLSYEWMERVGLLDLKSLWKALLKHAHTEFPEIWTKERMQIMQSALINLQYIVSDLEAAPQTMIHNDCNPRNMCLRRSERNLQTFSSTECPYEDPRFICLYDWELATISVPQHDLMEFLAFILPPSTSLKKWLELMDFYRRHLEYYSGVEYPLKKFIDVCNLASLDFALNRLSMYMMVHTFKDYRFLPRVVDSLFTYIQQQIESNGFTPYALKKPGSKL